MKQVLINLLSNAIKYNKVGGSVVVQHLTSIPGRIRICVKDSGEGLTAEKMTQLFQPFNRLGQEANGEEGTGIGDLQMPGMDGFEVMEGLKAYESEGYLPVIALTAQPSHKRRALQAGARDFISKPFDLIDVTTRIHNMLEVRLLYKKLENYTKVLEQRTLHDVTTGLPNRNLFNDRLTQAIALAKRHTWTLAVMFLELDRFKCINDSHGHAVGDEVLKGVAKRLLEHARGEDTVCRNGGDEFLYLLVNPQGSQNIERIAAALLKTIAQPIDLGDLQPVINASIGIAVYPGDGAGEEHLIKNADTAMYRAKSAGVGYIFLAHRKRKNGS